MAALRIVQESPNRLVLGVPIGQRLPNLFSLAIFLMVGYSLISSIFSGGSIEDPIQALVLLFFAFFGIRSIYSFLLTTTITIDGSTRLATRSRSLLGVLLGRNDLQLTQVRRVVVGSRAPVAFSQPRTQSGWLVWLDTTEGAPFLANWNGTHQEMLVLGNKVATILGKPLLDELEQARTGMQAAPEPQPIQNFGGGTSTTYAPPVALPSIMGGNAPASPLPDKSPPPNTLTLDSNSPNQARFEQDAGQPAPVASENVDMGDMAPGPSYTMPSTQSYSPPPTPSYTVPSTPSYSAPPAMELPNQAPMESIAPPATDSSSMASPFDQPAPPSPPGRRTQQELQKAIADDPTDSVAYYQLARMLQMQGASDQALSMYQNAVRLDPMNGAVQNDLGVLYFQRGKMKEAELAYRRAVGLDPFSVPGHYNLGLLLARTGRKKDADQEFNRVQQNASSDPERQLALDAMKGRMNAPILSPSG